MKKYGLLFGFCFFICVMQAQDFLKGKLYNSKGVATEILYDRTQLPSVNNFFKTLYKVYDGRKHSLCSITLSSNPAEQQFLITVKPENAPSFGTTVKYDKNISGLIFSNKVKPDTAYSIQNHYPFLFSCADTLYDYAVLHKFILSDNEELELDPLTKLRNRKHNERMSRLLQEHPYLRKLMLSKQDEFNLQLLQLRDSVNAKDAEYSNEVKDLRAAVEKTVSEVFGKKKGNKNLDMYDGEKRKGKPDGKGLLSSAGNVYQGIFSKGKLVSGVVNLKTEQYEYWGYYSNDTFNGAGLLMYSNGNYYLGKFTEGLLQDGISSLKSDSGQTFYGGILNQQHHGYGEVLENIGTKYAGEFLNGDFVKGYKKEMDAFGNVDYTKVFGEDIFDAQPKETEKFLEALMNHSKRN